MTDGNTAFLRAARSGNLEKVLEFINANVDINTSNSNGLNALHLASKDGHTKVVAELLKRGANVDAATKKGNTALHIASLAGQEEVVKLLIEHGATVNVQSQSGFTPLYMAAQENHERVVRFLLNNGANQSLATEDGFTPLAVAMQQGHDKVVTELLENDTRGKIRLPALHIAAKKDDCKAAALLLQSEHNPDITSKSGFTPLHIASHYGNDAIASLLLAKGADVNYAAKHNITPLHVAAKWGRNNMVVLLLEKGASIIAKTRDGLTPLHCAARSGHEQVVDTLLQRHAPITAKTKNGLAPLHMASQGDHVEAARVLLSHRAPVDDVTVDYLTALHVASHCGHVSVAKLLLDRKADPNARALNGFTPLHIACKKNRVKIVELLLKHGGSIEATTESGLSPLHVASFMGCMNIVIYLLQCEANPDVSTIRGETPLHLASRANQTDIIRILLRNGAQVDAKAREQQTPIHIASRLGNTDIVMLLLQHGANVDSVTKDLYTSLHIAAKEDQEEVALVLLENNASMTAATKKGFTPLHLAAKHGRTKIATLLLQRGAPVDAQGKNGVTPLHVASYYDHQGIALLLLDKGASPHATAKNGHTALHIAAKKNQMDIAAMLLEYGASAEVESKAGFTPIHLSAQEGHVDMTNLLLEHKAEVNHSSKNGLTPLHLCAQEDCVDVAKILIKHGADANAITKAGYTPLHIASHFGQLNMVRFLLSQNVKVDTPTATGYTSLHQAAQQGNSAIVAVLLDSGASPDSKNNQGQTALYIAQKLGYISVVEVLKNVTESGKAPAIAAGSTEEKYKVVAPETMQENFMSDSEDEGGDELYTEANGAPNHRLCDGTLYLHYYEKNTLMSRDDAANEQSYRYLTIDEMKSLGDDSLPLDVTREDRYDTTAGIDESISPQHTYNQLSAAPPSLDNVDVTRAPIVQTGFLVSFLVDAKGGAMRGCRHSGVRVIVPSQCVTMPTRVTCRYIRRDKPNHPPPPPLMEGEALASRILELGPVGVKFLGPVVIEVPNFAALRGNEREIVILRSDNGETWREHTVDSSNEAVQEILSRSFDKDGNQIQADEPGRITSIVTSDFPHYFAVVSRIRQEVHAIGPEGGMVSSSVVPQVQAVFPQGALTKKIKVGLQAQPIPSDLTAAVLGNCVAVSPIVTIEPRRRKFHKPITLTLPVPQAANKGMINQYSGDAPTLRLLCSITGGTSRAQWEDVTGSTPLTFVKECVSFTTTVSARFWLMDIRDIALATKKATELYREAIHIPFMAKFVVFAKRIDNHEARLRVFCMTDDKEDKTLECQEHFTEVAKSRDVEVLEGKKQLIELSGNLISVTKSGDQLKLGFNAFQENRLPFTVRIKDSHADPIGRMLFFKEQKPVKTSTPHPPICVLNIVLPDGIVPDPEFVDSSMRKYSFLNDIQSYHRSELRFSDISNLIGEDWIPLSEKLGIMSSEAAVIKSEYPDSVPKQALTMLRIWHQQAGTKASANILESALLSIGRDDIVHECILTMNEKIKLPKPSENGILSTSDGVSHLIENYHIVKSDISLTDDDEKKYTAEEKVVDDSETKRSVSERKREIEKRLQNEPNVRRSQERSDSEEKRSFLEGDRELAKSSVEQRDIIKNVIYDEKEAFEPTSLTFEQKRLSFEKGVSIDKIVPDVSTKDSDKFIQIEKSYPEKEEVPDKTKKIEKLVHIDRVNLIPNKDETVLHVAKKENEFVRAEVEVTQSKVSEQQSGSETENLSFAEKRLSFELGPGFKAGSQEEAIKEDSISSLTKAANERRDSELFEGVSLGLEKLDTKTVVSEPSFLSPKPIKTPPPSPAEFKETVLSKQGSNDSDKGTKISSKDGEIVENNVKAAEVPTEIVIHSSLNSSSNEEMVNVERQTESIEKEAFAQPSTADTVAELQHEPEERKTSVRCEYIKSGSVNEITYEDANVLCEEKYDLGVTIEPLTVAVDPDDKPQQIENFDPQDEEKLTELIDLLIEEENAKLVASGTLSYDSDTEDEEDEVVDLTSGRLETYSSRTNGNDYEEATRSDSLPKQNTYDMIEENCVISESKDNRLSVSPLPAQYEHFHSESNDKSPQRKVAFRLNSADDDLVYPGQTDSEECTSGSENSENSEDVIENNVEIPSCAAVDVVKMESVIAENSKTSTDIERKFERMASESLEEDEECGAVVEGEFHRIVSQLSHEEVDDCLNAWNETTVAINDDKTTKIKAEPRLPHGPKTESPVAGLEPAALQQRDTQRHSYAESETPLAPSRDSVPSNVDVDYFSKKKFWQSFESAGEGGNTPGPVPKPRASICTSSLKGDVPPMVSRRSAENVVVVDQPASTHKEQRVNKAESEDNVVFVTTSHASETRFKPSMKQMHSLTAYSTDSEAEYIASCGIDKLAYENVAFSEEDEEGTGESVEGNVKAKKMFFEQRIQKEQSFEEGRKELVGAIIENVRLPSKAEEHIDKSELEGTEKKKECLSDDTEEPSSATPVDVHTNASIEGVDSTQSESDITPEELQDKQSPLPESESNHVDGSSESETCVGQVEPEIVESSKIGKPQNGLKDSPKIGGFTTGPEIITESEKKSSVKPAATAELKSKPEMTEEIIFKSEEQHLTREKESVVVETKTFGETKFSIGENIVERKSEIIEKSSSSDTKSEEITSSIKIHTDGAVMGRKESRIPVRVPSESKKSEESVHVIKTDVEEKKNSSEEFTTIVSKSSEKIENKESNETSTHEISKKTEKLKNIFEEGKTKTETSYKKSGSGISTPVDKFAASSKDFECVSENWDTKKLDNLKSVSVESEINQAQILKEPKICSQKYEVPEVQDGDVNILKRDMKFEKAEKSVISSPGRELTNEKSSSGELKSERLDKKIEPVILEFTKPQVITDFECLQKSKVVHGIVPSSEEFASMIEKSPSIDIPKKLEHDVQEDVKLEIVRDRLPEDSVWETEFKKKSNIPVLETTNTEVDVNEIKFETVSDRLSEIAVCKIESKSESVSSNKFEMSLENVPSLEKQNSDTGKKEIIAENVKSDDIKSKPKETAIPILPDDSKTENVVDVSDSSVQKISEEKFENIIDIGVQSKTVDNVKELIKTISGTPRTIADTQAEETKLIKNSKENQEFQSEAIMNTTPNLDAVSATVTTTCKTICKSDPKIPVSKTFSGDRVIKSESRSRIPSQHSSSDQSDSAVSTIPSASTVKSSPYKESSEEDLPDYFPHSSLPGDESLHEAEISDERVVLCDYSDRRISDDDDRRNISICDEEVKLVATNLIDEIETEINRRPDILENLVLAGHIDYLPSESNDDITDEDLRSTGTEADIVMPDNDYFKKLETDDDCAFASSKIEFSSPTEYEINYEQAEEFNVLESVDFEEQVIPEEPECLDVKQEWKGSFGMESCMEQTHSKPPIPEFKKPSAEIRRKSSEESNARNDLMSPESGSSDPSRKYEEVSARVTRSKRSAVDLDPCSSSSESHYHSFASDNRTSSRPCSSDVEGLLSCAVPGTTGSSDYDTAVSHDTSYYSHDFHTAVSSASIHESLKSIDSESSGHLGSAEGSSEVSETLVPSSAELEHDIDIASNLIYDENRKGYHRKVFFEPYDTDIPLTVIKGVMQSTGTVLETSSKDQIGRIETITKLLPQDDKLISSCEDTSSLSITEPNVPTVIEMQSTDSDRMDTSLTSEQSLTMSAISNQLATSTYDCKEELEIDRRSVDTNTAYNAETYDNGSVTLITSTGEDKGKNYVSTQVTSEVTTEKPATVEGASSNISPESESFELVEKPDLLDDFVIIEEVAKEATEQDTEGKAIRITERRKSGTFVGDGPPKIETTLTKVEYYGGADEGCTFEGVTFEEKQKVKEYENSPPVDYELNEQEVEEGKKWIEMQFQTDSEVASAYEYTYERAPLEDIKEEDTDDMQSSKVGSVSSQISQSIGSLGSMKQSLSSTPDYDILAGKRCFSKNTEPDAVSQASLQEFERLEQLMALESMKSKLSGSQDSLGSSSPGDKKRSGDDISVSSLKEFEGLEFACREAEKVEERAKAEERSLSQIEEGHESQASESESCETLEKSCYESDEDDDYDKKMFEIDEIIRQAQSNVEKFVDRIEKTESLGRGDSFEETARIPDLEFDQPLTDTTHSSSEVYSGKKFIDNIDLSHSLTVSTDSLEAKQAKLHDDLMITSSDSLEGLASRSKHRTASDSLDSTDNRPDSPKSNISERSGERELLHDDADVALRCRISPNQVSSPDSMDATSSAATHATYHNEMDSIMSSSFTSGGSNTMVSSSENLDNIVSSYSNWLEGSQQQQTYTTTEMVETVVEDKRYVKTHRTVEIPAAAGHDIHITYTGPDARQLHEMDVASFAPGEFVSETREVDAEGNVRVKRVLETRTVLASDRVEESRKFILDPKTLVDDRQTKMQSDPIISPADTDTVMEDEKKPDASDKVKGTKQKH